jgi:hypothetical protein
VSLVLVVLLCAVLVGRVCGGSVDRLGALDCGDGGSSSPRWRCRRWARSEAGPSTPSASRARRRSSRPSSSSTAGCAASGLVALGLGANALVVALNGAMPVSATAAARAQVALDDVAAGLDSRHEVADGSTRLALLGDVVPVLLPLRPEVVSPGDVLVASGLGQLVVVGMLGGRQRVPVDA